MKRIFTAMIMAMVLWAGNVFPAQVTLTWDPNSESDLAGYDIYYGTASGNYPWRNDVGNVTTYTLNGLNMGVTYYLAATAYNTKGLQSGYSNEVVYTPPACSYSISPTSKLFSASGGNGSITVTTQSGCSWTASGSTWVTITSGANGTGNGTVNYSVSANSGSSTRMSAMSVASSIFTVTQNGATVASYTITATISTGNGGTISPLGTTTVSQGSSQSFIITPSNGYKIADVKVDGVSVGTMASYMFSNVTANHTISATFSLITPPSPPSYPVYRFRSLVTSGAYFYTIYESEKNSVVANNSRTLTLEGVGFYAYQTQQPGTFPVYRFRSLVTSGAYLYTIYESEKNSIVANNSRTFTLEGVGFYARQTQ